MTLEIITRSQWGARPPSAALTPMRYPVTECFQHHEAGPVFTSVNPADEAARMRDIQNSLMSRGYTDFAYSAAVFPSGRVYEGRDLTFRAAATLNHNATSLAIVWPGNLDVQEATAAQVQATADLIGLFIYAGKLTPDCSYRSHSAVYPTSCCGDHGREAMASVLTALHGGHPVTVMEETLKLDNDDQQFIKKAIADELTVYFSRGEGQGRIEAALAAYFKAHPVK